MLPYSNAKRGDWDGNEEVGRSIFDCSVRFGAAYRCRADHHPSKVLKSQASGAFVSTNFDFDHPDLSTPANYFDGEGIGNKGKFTVQGTNEFASDKKTCTVPGESTGAGTEFTLVGSIGISRFSATSDLLFSKATSATVCEDF